MHQAITQYIAAVGDDFETAAKIILGSKQYIPGQRVRKNLPEEYKGFYEKVAAVLPNRKGKWNVHLMIDKLLDKDEWNKQDLVQLRELHKQYQDKYSVIACIMERSQLLVTRKISREILSPMHIREEVKRWTKSELEALLTVVKKYYLTLYQGNNEKIDWKLISKYVITKSPAQCQYKWFLFLSSPTLLSILTNTSYRKDLQRQADIINPFDDYVLLTAYMIL